MSVDKIDLQDIKEYENDGILLMELDLNNKKLNKNQQLSREVSPSFSSF